MKLAILLCGLILAACGPRVTPLSAGLACSGQRATFEQYADCAQGQLAGATDTRNLAYSSFLTYAVGEIRAGRATDAQAFATDLQAKQLAAIGIAAEEQARADRQAYALQSMGQQITAIGAPQPRSSVTCNTFGPTTTCY